MPFLWRYLLSQFLKVFIFCVLAFIFILMTLRLDEIAYFATLGAQGLNTLKFALQQIPYILPIALPISALISTVLLVQKLSKSHELTAMRACGFSLFDIAAPVLSAALFLAALNFYIISEVSTVSHLNSGQLKNELRSINPLILIHSKRLMLMKGFYFDTLGPSRMGELAEDFILTSMNKQNQRLNLMTAKRLQATSLSFIGDNVTLLTALPRHDDDATEHLLIENIQQVATTTKDFSQMLETKVWAINNDHLRLPLLLVRLDQEWAVWKREQASSPDSPAAKRQIEACHRCYLEIMRRVSAAFSVFSLTLMGFAFGISISRNSSNKGLIWIVALAALYLIAFFGAKEADHALLLASLLYLLPHVIIVAASVWTIKRIAHGIE